VHTLSSNCSEAGKRGAKTKKKQAKEGRKNRARKSQKGRFPEGAYTANAFFSGHEKKKRKKGGGMFRSSVPILLQRYTQSSRSPAMRPASPSRPSHASPGSCLPGPCLGTPQPCTRSAVAKHKGYRADTRSAHASSSYKELTRQMQLGKGLSGQQGRGHALGGHFGTSAEQTRGMVWRAGKDLQSEKSPYTLMRSVGGARIQAMTSSQVHATAGLPPAPDAALLPTLAPASPRGVVGARGEEWVRRQWAGEQPLEALQAPRPLGQPPVSPAASLRGGPGLSQGH